MNPEKFGLKNPPIIEAVLDIDCELPPGQKIEDLQPAAQAAFSEAYPESTIRFRQNHTIEASTLPSASIKIEQRIEALQFATADRAQAVQVRAEGYSFNRLAPYEGFDRYQDEIRRTWGRYLAVAAPTGVRALRLRYINRLQLPMDQGKLDLDRYLRIAPRIALEGEMSLTGFLDQRTAVEHATMHRVTLVLASELPSQGSLPVLLDLTVAAAESYEVSDWAAIADRIQALRLTKNRIFSESLTQECLNLFQ